MRRNALIMGLLVSLVSLLAAATGAQAVVVDTSAVGQSSVAFNPGSTAGYVGVDLMPGSSLGGTNIPNVTSSGSCDDPALTSDLFLPPTSGLCWHHGPAIHRNETFALTWDGSGTRRYWSATQGYLL